MKRIVLVSAEVEVNAPDNVSGRDAVEALLQAAVGWLTAQPQVRPIRVRADHGAVSRVCLFTDPHAPVSDEGRELAGKAY